jgi:hypothetical protein
VVFIETPIFTADVCALLIDEEYAALQEHLVAMPNSGAVVAGTGGLRKKDDLTPKEKKILRKINAEW